jgi:hypothetical protein
MEFVVENEQNFRVYGMFGEDIFEYHYEPQYKLSLQIWKNYVSEQDVVAIFKYLAQFAFEHRQTIVGSLSDLSLIAGDISGANKWLLREYMPNAVKYGFRFAATVRPEDFFVELAIEDIIIIAKDVGYNAQYFNDFEEAYQWLTQELTEYLAITT